MRERRTGHPYWIYESMLKAPDILDECLSGNVISDIEALCNEFINRSINKVYCIGTGSSYLAGIAQAFAFRAINRISAEAWNSLDFRLYLPPDLGPSVAVLLNSHSGKSPGDVETIRVIRETGAFTVAVTDIENTPLAVACDYCFFGPGGAKHAMPSTRTYSAAIFRVLQFADALNMLKGKGKTGFSYSNEIAMIPGCMRRCVETFDNKGPEIARKLKGVSNFLVIAHGPNLSTAQEAAMGLTQATGLPAQGFLLEEYLHGQVQSLSAESSVMIIASPGPCIERLTRFTDVAKIIGAQVMLFAPEDSPSCIDNDECIPLPGGVNEVLTPAFYCTPFWYIVYHLSLLYREDPDRLSMDKSAFRESGLGQYKKEFV